MVKDLLGLDLAEIRDCLGPEAPPFRARQVYEGLYRQKAEDLVQISTLPALIRQELSDAYRVGLPGLERRYDSRSNRICGSALLDRNFGYQQRTVVLPGWSRMQ